MLSLTLKPSEQVGKRRQIITGIEDGAYSVKNLLIDPKDVKDQYNLSAF